MKRLFVMTAGFEKSWEHMGLDDEKLRELQNVLLENPDAGDVIPDLAGARKIRIPLTGRGKSGGGRVIYVDVVVKEQIFFAPCLSQKCADGHEPCTEENYS